MLQLTNTLKSAALAAAAAIVLAACGGSDPATPASPVQAANGPTVIAVSEIDLDAWVRETVPAYNAMWEEIAVLTTPVLLGEDTVGSTVTWLTATTQILDSALGATTNESPAAVSSYLQFRDRLESWSAAFSAAHAAIENDRAGIDAEVAEIDDLGALMTQGRFGSIMATINQPEAAAIDACLDVQDELEGFEPVLLCVVERSLTVSPEQVTIETMQPPVTLSASDGLDLRPFQDGFTVEPSLYVTTTLQVADPSGSYDFAALRSPIDMPADVQGWVDATSVAVVRSQGTVDVGGIASRWWLLDGDPVAIEATLGVPLAEMDAVALLHHPGIPAPQQLWPCLGMMLWEVPHPDGTVFAIAFEPPPGFRETAGEMTRYWQIVTSMTFGTNPGSTTGSALPELGSCSPPKVSQDGTEPRDAEGAVEEFATDDFGGRALSMTVPAGWEALEHTGNWIRLLPLGVADSSSIEIILLGDYRDTPIPNLAAYTSIVDENGGASAQADIETIAGLEAIGFDAESRLSLGPGLKPKESGRHGALGPPDISPGNGIDFLADTDVGLVLVAVGGDDNDAVDRARAALEEIAPTVQLG